MAKTSVIIIMNKLLRGKVILPFIFFLWCAIGAHSQNPQIDSLNRLLKVKREVPVLCELARENIMLENFEYALQLADEALLIALKEGDSLGIVMAHRSKGVVFRNREQLDQALHEILPAFKIAKRHSFLKEMKYLLNSMAIIYTSQAHYDRALDCNFQSLAIREAEGDQFGVSVSLSNIGLVYYKLKDYQDAYTYYCRSLKIKRQIGDVYEEESTLINIGLSEVYLGRYNKALAHFEEAFDFCGNECTDKVKLQGEFGFGAALYYMGKVNLAHEHFITSYNLAKKIGNLRFKAENLMYMGRIANQLNDLVMAEKHWKEAETIANSRGYNLLLMQVYKELYQLYSLRKKIILKSFFTNQNIFP